MSKIAKQLDFLKGVAIISILFFIVSCSLGVYIIMLFSKQSQPAAKNQVEAIENAFGNENPKELENVGLNTRNVNALMTGNTLITDHTLINGNHVEQCHSFNNKCATKDDVKLVEELYRFLESDKRVYSTYDDDRLTLVSMAGIMRTNRNTLSRAINLVTHKNFNCLINEFRIKEAVKIMADSKSDRLSMDQIAEKAGFDNRMTFYRNFKNEMGLSPSTYRKNMRDIRTPHAVTYYPDNSVLAKK